MTGTINRASRKKKWLPPLLAIIILLAITGFYLYRYYSPVATGKNAATGNTDWQEYNGNGSRDHYSALGQVTKENIRHLKVAWVYASGGADTTGNRSQMQCNPVIVNGVLYGVSAGIQVFAVDAATGKELWKTGIADNAGTLSRGITYFGDSAAARIFFGAGRWLYCFDAKNGRPLLDFGDSGRIDLKKGIERNGADNFVSSNTPNTIYKNLIIVGARVAESETALLGDVRAYNAYTGELVWTFRTIPAKSDSGYSSWSPEPREHLGGANAWAGMAIDRERGIVYIPTGSAAFDFYGGNRIGDNLFANCLLALDAATGKRIWHFQLVHHDIWDRDPPAPPNLVTVTRSGKKIDAVAQITKQGYIFLFNRVTGEPIYAIEEKSFPGNGVPGEYPSATQPVPVKPFPFTRQSFTENDFNSFVAGKDSLLQVLRQAKTGSAYIPVTDKMTIFFPGTDGGAQWGGAAADKEGILYVPAKEIPCYTTLISADQTTAKSSLTGAGVYSAYCASCHGKDLSGNHDGSIPSLQGIEKRMASAAVENIIGKGKGMMPSFSHVPGELRKAVIDFLLDKKASDTKIAVSNMPDKLPYKHTGYNRWYDSNGYPVNTPPWGTLTAVDLNTGERKWQVPLGEYKALMEKGIPATGTDNYGGPLVTASGLLFIAASKDEKFRAFDKLNGMMIWEAPLPAAGYASPSTYSVNGKQYIVIACGGGKLNTKSGDKYVAFALH
ncbi:MAG: PQQ-binding-like beta-propeller repeat protein [Chitinophagaceae bacterium]